MITQANIQIKDLKIGSLEVKKAYLNSTLVWQKENLEIWNYQDLLRLKQEVESGDDKAGKTYTVMANIDLEAYRPFYIGNSFSSRPFSGTINGNGKVISNFGTNSGSVGYPGLFRYCKDAVIYDLHLQGDMTGNGQIAPFCGNSFGTLFERCSYKGSISPASNSSCSLFIYSTSDTTIKSCYVSGRIIGKADSGDASGFVVTSSYNMPGRTFRFEMEDCFADVHLVSNTVAGITTDIFITHPIRISRSYVTGSLVGRNGGAYGFTSQLYDSNNISGNNNINNSVSALYDLSAAPDKWGRITGAINQGALLLVNLYNNFASEKMLINGGIFSGTSSRNGIQGETIASSKLILQTFYKNTLEWDFTTVWKMSRSDGEYKGYPVLQWMEDAAFWQGNGTENNPYQIWEFRHLKRLAEEVNSGDTKQGNYYRLMDHIDLQGTEENQWTPIGNNDVAFQGTFDGNGKTIKNLYINAPDSDALGLFGTCIGGVIHDIELMNIFINGNIFLGGLIGGTSGSETKRTLVFNCAVSGAIKGNEGIGGLIGFSMGGTDIYDCFSFVDLDIPVEANICGGIIGGLPDSTTVRRCYANGNLPDNAGAITGYCEGTGQFDSNFFDIDSCGTKKGVAYGDSAGVEGKTSFEMRQQSTYSGWDFNNTWKMSRLDGKYIGLPIFKWIGDTSGAWEGNGTQSDPYLIRTVVNLKRLAVEVNSGDSKQGKYYKLMNDLDLEGNDRNQWTPIGNQNSPFKGNFNGNSKIVKNLYIDDPQNRDFLLGLFGLCSGATIYDLGVENIFLKGYNLIGGLAAVIEKGDNSSGKRPQIYNCYSTGNIIAGAEAGGLIGVLVSADLYNCYSSVHLTPELDMIYLGGGLVGSVHEGSYIRKCYACGNIQGAEFAGGFAGAIQTTDILSSNFFDIEASGVGLGVAAGDSSGVNGISYQQMIRQSTFTDWDFDTVWKMSERNGEYQGYPVFKWQSDQLRWDGLGTENDPYRIKNVNHLKKLAVEVNNGDSKSGKYYKLMNVVDLRGSETNQWEPIGKTDAFKFEGNLDGNGKVIKNLYIDKPGLIYAGLFGIAYKTVIKDLGLENIFINAGESVGGLAGSYYGDLRVTDSRIENCYVTGYIKGNQYIGGLAGTLSASSVIMSFSLVDIVANQSSGGFTGDAYSTDVTNCYAAGKVTAGNYSGGFAGGGFWSSTAVSCYFDRERAGMDNATGDRVIQGITGKTSAQMKQQSAYTSWDFNSIWKMSSSTGWYRGYPIFQWKKDPPVWYGNGTSNRPYQIFEISHLKQLAEEVNRGDNKSGRHYKLMADLNLMGSETNQWTPIGNTLSQTFNGHFDGNGKIIKNLYVDIPGATYVGLFGYCLEGTIKNLGVENVYVAGREMVGGLTGLAFGKANSRSGCLIENCYTTGEVIGNYDTGGLAGALVYASIRNCFSMAKVTSDGNYSGGIVGEGYFADISCCYATGRISGGRYAGGFAGGDLYDCIATSNYFDRQTSGITNGPGMGELAGISGKTTLQMKTQSTYVNWDFNNIWKMSLPNEKFSGYPILKWQDDAHGTYKVSGTVFPFVLEGDPDFDSLFPVTASLYPLPAGKSADPIADLLNSTPLYTTLAVYYDGSRFVPGTPKYPGSLGLFNNPGEPINWSYIGIVPGSSNNTEVREGEIPETPIGVFTFTEVESGEYTLVLSRPGYLLRLAKVAVNNEVLSLGHRELIPGDVDGNFSINSYDRQKINASISSYPDAKYNPKYDLNADGRVDARDATLMGYYSGIGIDIYKDTSDWISEFI